MLKKEDKNITRDATHFDLENEIPLVWIIVTCTFSKKLISSFYTENKTTETLISLLVDPQHNVL